MNCSILATTRASVMSFLKDDVLTLSATLAFYTLLSFAPLMVIAVLATSTAGPAAQSALLDQISSLIGPAGLLAVLLIWMYCAGAIFFLGAEHTKTWLKQRGIANSRRNTVEAYP